MSRNVLHASENGGTPIRRSPVCVRVVFMENVHQYIAIRDAAASVLSCSVRATAHAFVKWLIARVNLAAAAARRAKMPPPPFVAGVLCVRADNGHAGRAYGLWELVGVFGPAAGSYIMGAGISISARRVMNDCCRNVSSYYKSPNHLSAV